MYNRSQNINSQSNEADVHKTGEMQTKHKSSKHLNKGYYMKGFKIR